MEKFRLSRVQAIGLFVLLTLIVTFAVIFGTYLGSAVIAHIALMYTGMI